MKYSSIVSAIVLTLLASSSLFAYTVNFERSFPFGYGSKSFEITDKSSYERALKLRDLITQNIKDQNSVSSGKTTDANYNEFLRLRQQNRENLKELDSILGVKR